jgi:predicted  nucleic acid-binding Zn-ribbon protein
MSPRAETVQIRRQRIRDAAGKKAAWRDKVEALKKEELALQPQVDRLASERPHTLKLRSDRIHATSGPGGVTAAKRASVGCHLMFIHQTTPAI